MANKTRPNMSCLNQISRKQCLIRTIEHNHWLELPNQNWTIEHSFEIRRWLAKLIPSNTIVQNIWKLLSVPHTLFHIRDWHYILKYTRLKKIPSKKLSNSDWWLPNNIGSVVEFQRWWVLKSKIFCQESTYS